MRLPKREENRRFWELIRAGAVRRLAGVGAGVSARTGERWFLQATQHPRIKEAAGTQCQGVSV
jgi:hypothetical protein